MKLRRVFLALFLALAAFPARAQAGDAWEAWRSIFADFFLGPETREEFRWKGSVAPGGAVEVKGVNGAIRAEAAAGDDVEIVALKRGRRSSPRDVQVRVVSFQTVNGSITLALPREASTAVEARTVNGRIAVDFELAGARTTRRELFGTIGAGGRRLALTTVNGGIRLRQAN